MRTWLVPLLGTPRHRTHTSATRMCHEPQRPGLRNARSLFPSCSRHALVPRVSEIRDVVTNLPISHEGRLRAHRAGPRRAPGWRLAVDETRSAGVTLRFLAAPTDAGHSGNVSGGRVLEWIDKAGYACAVGWSGALLRHGLRRQRPLRPARPRRGPGRGPGRLVHTGRSRACMSWSRSRSGDPTRRACSADATACLMVFVAVDGHGKPVAGAAVAAGRRAGPERQQADALRRDRAPGARSRPPWPSRSYTEAAPRRRITLRFLAAPTDVNWGGKAHGGTVMRWIDEAAHVLRHAVAGQRRQHRGLLRRRPVLPAAADRAPRRGGGPAAAHRPRSMHIGVHVRSGDPAGDASLAPDDALPHRLRGSRPGRPRDGDAHLEPRLRRGRAAGRPRQTADPAAGRAAAPLNGVRTRPLTRAESSKPVSPCAAYWPRIGRIRASHNSPADPRLSRLSLRSPAPVAQLDRAAAF